MLATVAAWWGATGVIAWLDGLPTRTFPASFAGATVLLVLCGYALASSAGDTSVAGAWIAFLAALGAWAWIEISFLMGYVTGPRRTVCRESCGGAAHFTHAVGAILWHELAIIALVAAVAWATRDAPNLIGLATLLVLWVMRTSAKLNLFLGVPNLGEAFLPDHLRYLVHYLRRRPMNALFPVSVTGGTLLAVALGSRALEATEPAQAVGWTLVATLAALAVIEHWFMVLPLRPETLWRWSLGNHRDAAGETPVVAGKLAP